MSCRPYPAAELSFSTVDHLRWDLEQIFAMAVAEDYLRKNPAALLYTPREARRAEKRNLTWEEVRRFLSILEMRERLIWDARFHCRVAAGRDLCTKVGPCTR